MPEVPGQPGLHSELEPAMTAQQKPVSKIKTNKTINLHCFKVKLNTVSSVYEEGPL